jgi:S1-C subfamily serine protease
MRRLVFALVLLASGFVAGFVLSSPAAFEARRSDSVTAGPTGDPSIESLAGEPDAPAPVRRPAAQSAAGAAAAAGGLPDFSDVASRAVQAVTNIAVLQVTRTRHPFFDDPFFRQFFEGQDDLFGYQERRGTSAGSGVIVSSDGHVLTNGHVLGSNVREITVVLADSRSRPARVVGVDPLTDLAVLKIEGAGYPTLPWGDSSRLRVAEWVLAIGNPYQIGQTVTLGIVSALSRTVNIAAYEDFIQTDAAINPGNSGGALVNRRGELVGINTAIFSESGGYQGIGFAVPSNLARRVLDDLRRFGEVRRGSIGSVRTVPVTEPLAREFSLTATSGVLVWQMSRNADAYQAGLRPGDVIERFGGETVTDPAQFFRLVADTSPGTVVTVQVRRQNRSLEIKVPVRQMTLDRRGAD